MCPPPHAGGRHHRGRLPIRSPVRGHPDRKSVAEHLPPRPNRFGCCRIVSAGDESADVGVGTEDDPQIIGVFGDGRHIENGDTFFTLGVCRTHHPTQCGPTACTTGIDQGARGGDRAPLPTVCGGAPTLCCRPVVCQIDADDRCNTRGHTPRYPPHRAGKGVAIGECCHVLPDRRNMRDDCFGLRGAVLTGER